MYAFWRIFEYISAYMQKKEIAKGKRPAEARQETAQDAPVRYLADACARLARIETLLESMLGVK